jgi:hypothetical protein
MNQQLKKKSNRSNAGKPPKRYGWSVDAMSADVITLTCKAENGVDKEHWSHATEKDFKKKFKD